MLKKTAVVMMAVLVTAGCRSREPRPSQQNRNPEKIALTINVNQPPAYNAAAEKPAEKPKKAAARSSRKKSSARPAAKVKKAPTRRQDTPARGSMDGSLNSVEQQYLQEVRMRNQQQKQENERRVFGGFSAGELFKSK